MKHYALAQLALLVVYMAVVFAIARPATADTTQDRYLERIARALEKISERTDKCR